MRPKGSRARPSTRPLKGIWPRSAYVWTISPSRRERTVNFALPPIEKAADIVAATAALASAVAKGELTPGESAAFSQLLGNAARAIEVSELEDRLAKLEAAVQRSEFAR